MKVNGVGGGRSCLKSLMFKSEKPDCNPRRKALLFHSLSRWESEGPKWGRNTPRKGRAGVDHVPGFGRCEILVPIVQNRTQWGVGWGQMKLGVELFWVCPWNNLVVLFVSMSLNWETPSVNMPLSWAIQKVSGDTFSAGSSKEEGHFSHKHPWDPLRNAWFFLQPRLSVISSDSRNKAWIFCAFRLELVNYPVF